MKKSLLLIIVELIYFISIFLLLPSIVIRNRFSNHHLTSTKIIPITPANPIKFSFVPLHDQLNSLSFELKNPNLINHDQYFVQIYDYHQQLIHEVVFYGSNIGDPNRIDLKFPPLTVDLSVPLTVIIKTNSLDPNQISIFVDEDNTPVYYSTFRPGNFTNTLTYVINQQKNHLLSFPRLHLIIYLAIIFILNIIIIKSFFKDHV